MIKLVEVEKMCTVNALWLLPTLIVLLQFIFKLVISDKTKFHKFWVSLLQTPVDIGFLAISIFAGSIILDPSTGKFIMFIILIVIISIIIISWKLSPEELNGKCIIISGSLMLLNFSLSLFVLVVIINNL